MENQKNILSNREHLRTQEFLNSLGDKEALSIPRSVVGDLENGLLDIPIETVSSWLESSSMEFRRDVEFNPTFLQVIPYVLISHQGSFFAVKRIAGDSRLVGRISLGMGGHIESEDVVDDKLDLLSVENALLRELEEEIGLRSSDIQKIDYRGVIVNFEESDPVSLDHIGLFYVAELTHNNIQVKELDVMEGGFSSTVDILKEVGNLETWSRIIVESEHFHS